MPKTYEQYSTKELLMPMYLAVAIFYALKAIREKFILPRVELIHQHGTLIGIEPKVGKEKYLILYNAHKKLSNFLVGMFLCWNFVVLASM